MRLLLSCWLMAAPAVADDGVTLVLSVQGVTSTEGQLLVAVYGDGDGFPGDPKLAVAKSVVTPVMPTTRVELTGLAPGSYAAVVVHDVNGNGALDTGRVLPIPKEPIGVSRDAKGFMGPPKFKDAVFEAAAGRHTETFTLVSL